MTLRDVLVEACYYAKRSPDPSTQNAAVVCHSGYPRKLTWAVNEFPQGVANTPERWERPLKYSIVEHAERGAIYNAARYGISTLGATLVCPWAACADCARGIIQAGFDQLLTLAPDPAQTHERWDASIAIAMKMLEEAGVLVTYVPAPLGCDFTILRNGEPFRP